MPLIPLPIGGGGQNVLRTFEMANTNGITESFLSLDLFSLKNILVALLRGAIRHCYRTNISNKIIVLSDNQNRLL